MPARTSAIPAGLPRYRSPKLVNQLPPAKLPLFRAIVAHPPTPSAVAQATAKAQAGTPTPTPLGSHNILYSTSPRPLIPLAYSPSNHRLWNPPAADARGTRVVERDESGRLAKFTARFGGGEADEVEVEAARKAGKEAEKGQFEVASDLSFLEGESLQDKAGRALGKKDIVGPSKTTKKGKK